jgi:hypothetical protein
MRKPSFSLIILSGFLLAACADDGKDTSGNKSGTAGSGAGASGESGGIAGISGSQNVGGTGVMTLPDGGMIPLDPTKRTFFRDDTVMSGLDAGTIEMLKKGGTSCSASPVYPVEGTVFPRGLPAPTVMWNGAFEAAYVHMRYEAQDDVDYQFALKGADPGALTVPQDAWDKIMLRSKDKPLLTTLTVISGGNVSSCDARWTIAGGTLTGAVYYNTYSAPGAMFEGQGAVMRLKLGQKMSEVYLQDFGAKNGIKGTGPCISCHSVSFDGSTLVASYHDYGGNAVNKVFKFEVSSYAVTADVQPTPVTSNMHRANFGGLTPDGKRMLIMGNPQCTNGAETFPRAPNNFMMVEGPTVAKVIDASTGTEIPATGLKADNYMWMPQFSPDGTKVVFNHAKPGAGGTDRRELAVMDYDYATNTFSNLKVIATGLGTAPSMQYAPRATLAGTITDTCTPALVGAEQTATLATGTCSGPCYPGWPFFTPDGRGVVFLLTNEPDFTSAFPGRETITKAELWYADVASGQTVKLANANANAQDNFYPTVMPVALGGYYWLFFTSKRPYGNKVYPEVPPDTDLSAISTSFAKADARNKRIWVAALRPLSSDSEFPMGLQDISAPAFFLDGQSESGNVRAFTTLNPCTKSGPESTCTSGLDCCSGFCFIKEQDPNAEFEMEPVGYCTDEPPTCSKTNDACNMDSDCCKAEPGQRQNTCIGGYCTYLDIPE